MNRQSSTDLPTDETFQLRPSRMFIRVLLHFQIMSLKLRKIQISNSNASNSDESLTWINYIKN